MGSTVSFNREFATEREAIEFRDQYLRDYHPMGYGTRVDLVEKPDGTWLARVSRYNSAD